MNTNEQITALLHGELTNDRSIAELMHILSVSPEKREVFLENIRLSRSLLRAGDGLAPSPTAAQGVWAQIAAMEPGLNVAAYPIAAAPRPPAAAERKSDWKKWGLLLLLLLTFGSGGYLIGSHNVASDGIAAAGTEQTPATTPAGKPAAPAAGSDARLALDHKENAAAIGTVIEKKEEKGGPIRPAGRADAATAALRGRVAELNALLTAERERNERLLVEIELMRSSLPKENADGSSSAIAAIRPEDLQNAVARPLPLVTQEERQNMEAQGPSTSPLPTGILPLPLSSAATPARNGGAWRLEMRQHLRSSLPGVNGLEEGGGILSDREFGAGFRFTAIQRSMRLGVAIGGTTFAQIYHTNTGGALNDTIIEQAPALTYGRAYIAPSIFEGETFAGALELGGGVTELGPIGTAGLNLEYRAADRVTFQAGVSSWLLWTSYRNQLHTSTNLNAHFGVSLNP